VILTVAGETEPAVPVYVAVIVELPIETAVTKPFVAPALLTVATGIPPSAAGGLAVQLHIAVTVMLVWSLICRMAWYCPVAPTLYVPPVGLIVRPIGATGPTVSIAVPVTPRKVTVMVTVPCPVVVA
jgi:hypothetical protein